ncbi:hypothetical protein EJ06DRAFT_387423 [Trichodelitschia bisporula]|uniref:Zn(2)-C6 fungal-type domain-containing protein n=1 Tax=Trichodelitschia bisporula TaxID=703511 RepID=A0A6G1HZN2_9PEZI|nr:hypothetical protein EJ06DRAFT_387423 [Trichodelitschia bisporula]
MYMLAPSTHSSLPTSSTWRLRGPDLTLAKSPQWSFSSLDEQVYPSPPMSNSPTTPRRSSHFTEQDRSASGVEETVVGSVLPPSRSIQTRSGFMAGQVLPVPAPQGQARHVYASQPGPYFEQRYELQPRPLASTQHLGQPYSEGMPLGMHAPAPMLGMQPPRTQLLASPYAGPTSISAVASSRFPRTSRRAKAHVAKACQNCKKAHLSCDDARPCARCVGSGKQATCIDVEHKKRGRPRLRDDRDRPEVRAQSTSQAPHSIQAPTTGLGHRRAEPFRILRSHDSEDRERGGLPAGVPQMAYSSRSYAQLEPPIGEAGSYYTQGLETSSPPPPPLVAYLNLNLRILKANDTFRDLLADGRDVRGRMLSDFMASGHDEALQRLQSELRDERSRREPTFLPSIFPDEQEQNAVQGLDEWDLEGCAGIRRSQQHIQLRPIKRPNGEDACSYQAGKDVHIFCHHYFATVHLTTGPNTTGSLCESSAVRDGTGHVDSPHNTRIARSHLLQPGTSISLHFRTIFAFFQPT